MAANQKVTFGLGGAGGLRWDGFKEAVLTAEALGFDSYLASDHLTPNFRLGTNADQLEAFTMLGGTAALTKRVRLGTLVSPAPLRAPALLAKCVATLDHVSEGRAIVGVGTADSPNEYKAYGVPYPGYKGRLEMLEETLQILNGLFTGAPFNHAGNLFTLVDADFDPPVIQKPRPTIIVAGGSEAAMRLAVRYGDDWNFGYPLSAAAERNKQMDAICKEEGRDPSTIVRSRQIQLVLTDDKAVANEFVERHIKALLQRRPKLGDTVAERGAEAVVKDLNLVGGPEEVKDSLRQWIAAGVTHINIPWPRPANIPMLERFMSQVAPEFL